MTDLTPAEQIVRDALGETDAKTYNGHPHDLDALARRTAAKLRDHARATTPGDDRGRELAERPDRATPRDKLAGRYRALSDVLDDYLMREYGRMTSHNGWDLFLDLLAEQGYEVCTLAAPAETEAGDLMAPAHDIACVLNDHFNRRGADPEGMDADDAVALLDAAQAAVRSHRCLAATPPAPEGEAGAWNHVRDVAATLSEIALDPADQGPALNALSLALRRLASPPAPGEGQGATEGGRG